MSTEKQLPAPPEGMRWLEPEEEIRTGDSVFDLGEMRPAGPGDVGMQAGAVYWYLSADGFGHFCRPIQEVANSLKAERDELLKANSAANKIIAQQAEELRAISDQLAKAQARLEEHRLGAINAQCVVSEQEQEIKELHAEISRIEREIAKHGNP